MSEMQVENSPPRLQEQTSEVQIIEKQVPVSPKKSSSEETTLLDEEFKQNLVNFDQNQADSPKAAANSPKSKKSSLGWANDHGEIINERETLLDGKKTI